MLVMILEQVSKSARGELSRWLIEAKPGVYIGHVSALVRDLLWEKCNDDKRMGVVFQAWSTNTEQHFQMRMSGECGRKIVDWEGVQLICETNIELEKAKKNRIDNQ